MNNDDHTGSTRPPAAQTADRCAQELIRDWELLFWSFLLFGLARLAWIYLYRSDISAFQLGVSCGFILSGSLGFLMRWVLSPRTKEH